MLVKSPLCEAYVLLLLFLLVWSCDGFFQCSIFQRIGRCFQRKKSKNAKSSNRCKACYEKFKSILKKIKTLWAAPITKFYTNFAFYIVFLFLFTLAVMWPSCGNRVLDCIVWLWAATIAVENARVAYAKHHVRFRNDIFITHEANL